MLGMMQPAHFDSRALGKARQPLITLLRPGWLPSLLEKLARFSFLSALVLAPFRYRIILQPRAYPPVYQDYTDLLLFPSDIALVVTLLLWIGSLGMLPRRISTGPKWLSLSLLGLTLSSLVSVLVSVDPLISAFQFGRMLVLDGIYLFLIDQFTTLRPLAVAAAVQVAIQAGVGLTQVLSQGSIGLQMFGEHYLDPAQSGVSVVWNEFSRSLRAYGLTDHPNILGGCLAFGLLLLTACYFQMRSKYSPGRKLLGIAVYCLGCQALLLTFSRSAWLAWSAGVLLMLGSLLRKGNSRRLRNASVLVIAASLSCLPLVWRYGSYIVPRLSASAFNPQTNESRAINERVLLIRSATEILSGHLTTGVGLGVYPIALKEAEPNYPIYYQPAHFSPVASAAEVGVPGAFFYSMALTFPILVFGYAAVFRPGLRLHPEYIVASALVLALLIVGAYDYYTWNNVPGRLWQWTAWGVWASVYRFRIAREE